jgi:hypothetical protein
VADREVERPEVVPVGLDLGALGHGEAHADEHVLQLGDGLGDEVEVADLPAGQYLGEVEPLGLQLLAAGVGLELGPAAVEQGLHGLEGGVDRLADRGPVGGVEGAQLLAEGRQFGLGPDQLGAEAAQRLERGGRADAVTGAVLDLGQPADDVVAHGRVSGRPGGGM